MKTIINPKRENWSTILKRPTQTVNEIEQTVNQIFTDIQINGDKSIKKYTSIFDGVELDNPEVTEKEIKIAVSEVSSELKNAIALAKANIEKFHLAQKTEPKIVETVSGVECWQEKKPIEKVGLYIPGGTAPLFSTILMLAVPAKIAGCKEIILCSPPNSKGRIANEIIYAAKLCGVTEIYKVGGIQAIAALTFGTEIIPKVYKIYGPGNQFVTVAKQLATKFNVAIDIPAGPSELLVIADETAVPSFVAADLLSQAEHGTDSQVILVSTSSNFTNLVAIELLKQVEDLPRKEIAKRAIENSKIILVATNAEAINLSNQYAPEHLIVCTNDNPFFIENITNAGSVFIGNYTPESAGDYASGTNHTLPTNGFAKAYSGVNLDSFTKTISFQKISKQGIENIGKAIQLMAEAEGLQAHKNAVTLRLSEISNV